ncbi:MAG: arginine--tRNA ligase, partial [Patescibacteria group bacterium]|nr:arginine--tRNA ligase [Patescibacteria group bacterium]
MLRKEVFKIVEESMQSLKKQGKLGDFAIPEILIEHPKNKDCGDYSVNIAMILAKQMKESPMKIADLLVSEMKLQKQKSFEKIEVASPGFINFFVSVKMLNSELKRILKNKGKYGESKIGKGKTIIIDYSSANIAKPFSVSHLRSTIIGQAIYNLYSFLGYKTIGDNHIGDWGTQFGKLICAIKKWGDEKEIAKDPINNLVALYVKFHEQAEKNSELEEEARKWFKELERGNAEAKRLWKKCVKWSLSEFNKVYKTLDIKIDLSLGESFYEPMLKSVIKEALDKNVAEKSQGAIIIRYPNDSIPPFMIRKSDGATLYATRDLATIKYRRKQFKPYKIIYEVGSDQTLHFKQLFWAAELLGWGKKDDYVHIAHGIMRLETGKMRTRKGEIILLQEIIKEACSKVRKIIDKKHPDLKAKEKDKIAKIIGVGAVKYNGLHMRPGTNIVFKWENVLNLEGDSGPYLQYAYARAKSIVRKSKIKEIKLGKKEFKQATEIHFLKQLIKFPEIVEKATENHKPNLICGYLFDLAQDFNSFYETTPVLKEKDNDLKMMRLALVQSFAQVIKNGLGLLGIDVL